MYERIDVDAHKIMSMDASKRDRILNAAMSEFYKGYKNASTDAIVRKAGISKGLLFHYFGTKKGLFDFLAWYAFDVVAKEYFDLINTSQSDCIERLWQMVLLKRDLTYKHPTIFEFLSAVYLHSKEDPDDEYAVPFKSMQEEVIRKLYDNVDASLFRDDLDVKMAFNTILWTLTGYSESKMKPGKKLDYYQKEYERYLSDIKDYCDMLRKLFYKQPKKEDQQ